jgi:internalin A
MAAVGERAGRAGTYWRDGFAFYDEDTKGRVLVEQAWSKDWSGEIAVSCVGGHAATLLERVLKLIDERVERFGAKVTSRSSSLDRTPEDDDGSPRPKREPEPDGKRRDPAEALKPGYAPRAEREFYVSYAWGDDTPEGIEREKAVDDFCAAAEAKGIKVIRDKEAMKRGDEIPKFMDRLAQAEQVFAFLSDKYLKSPYCMYELFGVWRECAESEDRFRERTSFFVLPSAQIYTEAGIDTYTAHWANEAALLKAKIARQLKQDRGSRTRVDRWLRFQRYAQDSEQLLENIRNLKHEGQLDAFIADVLAKLVK